MKMKIRIQKTKQFLSSPQFLLAAALSTVTTTASARIVEAIPEPSLLSLVGAGIVVGIIAYRMKGGK